MQILKNLWEKFSICRINGNHCSPMYKCFSKQQVEVTSFLFGINVPQLQAGPESFISAFDIALLFMLEMFILLLLPWESFVTERQSMKYP